MQGLCPVFPACIHALFSMFSESVGEAALPELLEINSGFSSLLKTALLLLSRPAISLKKLAQVLPEKGPLLVQGRAIPFGNNPRSAGPWLVTVPVASNCCSSCWNVTA